MLKHTDGACRYMTAALLFMTSSSAFAFQTSMNLPNPVSDADYYDQGQPAANKVALGKQLFFDKILSGNNNISCGTCHHVLTDTGDGLSLPIGEGARGLGVTRNTGIGADAVHERVPRNAPPVFNLGAMEFRNIFHDGRVQVGPNGELLTPAGDRLPPGLDNILAAQAMFPVTSATEMAGQTGENPIANATAAGNLAGPGGVWEQLAVKLQGVDGYVKQFIDSFDDIQSAADIRYVHAANAIAAFEASAWRASKSPFDRFLAGHHGAMSRSAKRGMRLFYGKANCVSCHSGKFQTDHQFYAIAMPQIGAGRGDGDDGHDDFGREQVTGDPLDRFKFRTPTLRNVALTAPYGHAGAYNSLEAVVRHHLDPVNALHHYDQNQAVLPSRPDLDAKDFIIMNDPVRVAAIADANALMPVYLSDHEVMYLLDFLRALTDPASIDLRKDIPSQVPSGLSIVE